MTITQQNALKTAIVAARQETVDYLYPEPVGRATPAHALLAVDTDRSVKIGPNNLYQRGDTAEGYLCPLYTVSLSPVRPDFLFHNKHFRLLGKRQDEHSDREGFIAPPAELNVWEEEDGLYRLPTARQSVEAAPAQRQPDEGAAPPRYAYLGLEAPEGATDFHLRFADIPAGEVILTLDGKNIPVRRPLDDVFIPQANALDKEVFTLYQRRKAVAEAYGDVIRLTLPKPGEQHGSPEIYPPEVQERLRANPSLIVLTLHPRPRPNPPIDWSALTVDANVIPCWSARLLNGDSSSKVIPLAVPEGETLLAVAEVRDGNPDSLINGMITASKGTYRVRKRRSSERLKEELDRVMIAGNALLEEVKKGELPIRENAARQMANWEHFRTAFEAAKQVIVEAPGLIAGEAVPEAYDRWSLQFPLKAQGGGEAYYHFTFYSCLITVAFGVGDWLEAGNNSLPAARLVTNVTEGDEAASQLERLDFVKDNFFTLKYL